MVLEGYGPVLGPKLEQTAANPANKKKENEHSNQSLPFLSPLSSLFLLHTKWRYHWH